MNRKKRIILSLYTAFLLILGFAFGWLLWLLWSGNSQWLPTLLDPLRNMPAENVFYLSIGIQVAALLLAFIGYVISLTIRQEGRPLKTIYLLGVSACAPLGGILGGLAADISMLFSAVQAAVVTFITPCLVFLFEWVMGLIAKSIGNLFEGWERHSLAGSAFSFSRLFRPFDPDMLKRHAMAEFMAGNYVQAIPIFERLRDRGESDRVLLEDLESAYRHERQWEKDVEVLKDLLVQWPGDTKYLRLLAQGYERLERWGDALEARENSLDSRNTGQLEDTARLALRAGRLDRALTHARRLRDVEGKPFARTLNVYKEVLTADEQCIEAAEEMAEIYVRSDNEMKAAALWEKILEMDPKKQSARRQLVEFFRHAGKLEPEEAHLRLLTEQDPTDRESYIRLAENLEEQKRSEEAQGVFYSSMQRFADDYRFAYGYSRLALAAGNLKAAEDALKKAEQLADKSDASRLAVLRRRLDAERTQRELAELKQIIRQNPSDSDARYRLIEQFAKTGDWLAVRVEFDQLLSARPDLRSDVIQHLKSLISTTEQNFLLQDYLADLLFIDRRFDEVLEMYENMAGRSVHKEESLIEGCRKILRAAPDFAPALGRLGTLLTKTEQWEMSIETNRRYMEIVGGTDLTKAKELFQANLSIGAADEAESCASILLAEDPRNLDIRTSMADVFEEQRQFENAMRMINECIGISPGNISFHRRLDVLTRKRKRQRIEELERDLATQTDTPELHFELADLHEQFQEYDSAIAHFQKAARSESLHNIATARLGHGLALRGMFDLAGETLLQVSLPNDSSQDEVKNLLYESGLLFEEEGLGQKALELYKIIFRTDASFRDIVSRLSRFRS